MSKKLKKESDFSKGSPISFVSELINYYNIDPLLIVVYLPEKTFALNEIDENIDYLSEALLDGVVWGNEGICYIKTSLEELLDEISLRDDFSEYLKYDGSKTEDVLKTEELYFRLNQLSEDKNLYGVIGELLNFQKELYRNKEKYFLNILQKYIYEELL